MVQVGDKYAVHNALSLREVFRIDGSGGIFAGPVGTGIWTEAYSDRALLECDPNFKYWTVLGGAAQPYVTPTSSGFDQSATHPGVLATGDTCEGANGGTLSIIAIDYHKKEIHSQSGMGTQSVWTSVSALEGHPSFLRWTVFGGQHVGPKQAQARLPHVGDRFLIKGHSGFGEVTALSPTGPGFNCTTHLGLWYAADHKALQRAPWFDGWAVLGGASVGSQQASQASQMPSSVLHVNTPPGYIRLQYAYTAAAPTDHLKLSMDYAEGLCQACGTVAEDRQFSTFSFKFCPKCRKEVP